MELPLKSLVAALLAALLAAPGLAAQSAADGSVRIRSGAARIDQPVRSVRALRDAGVVKQGFDYSCGSAALATLLTYGVGDATDEQWVLQNVFATASEDQKRLLLEKGLSLLDLQRVTEQRGHRAQGFRIAPDQLAKLSRPVIVFIKPRGYEHFAVLKGISGDRVHLADPSLGNVRMPLYRFVEMWALENGKGVIFAVEPRQGVWRNDSPLRVSAGKEPPLELLTARELFEVGKPYPLTLPAAAIGR